MEQLNYYGLPTSVRKDILAGCEGRITKIIAGCKPGIELSIELTEAEILNQAWTRSCGQTGQLRDGFGSPS